MSRQNISLIAGVLTLGVLIGASVVFFVKVQSVARAGGELTLSSISSIQAESVRNIKENILKYNGKSVTFRASIVDSYGNSVETKALVVADSKKEYFASALNFGGGERIQLYIVPVITHMKPGDIGIFTGTLDGTNNTVTLTDARKIGEEPK